ncbi:MAG: hypothetical protein R3C59_08340 [Planctomycetaceae bacterium]
MPGWLAEDNSQVLIHHLAEFSESCGVNDERFGRSPECSFHRDELAESDRNRPPLASLALEAPGKLARTFASPLRWVHFTRRSNPEVGPFCTPISNHLLTMKLAGIDGVIVDWYGLTDFRDYAILHRNTTRVLEQCERLKMKFIICYEDQTIPALEEAERIMATERVSHAATEIMWLSKYWFKSGSYVKLDDRPLLLSFGQTGLTDEEWSQCLARSEANVTYFSQHHRRAAAVGAFDWPVPSEAMKAFERFHKDARSWPHAIPVAFPRFVDIYAQAKVGLSYGRLDDDEGKSFHRMLELGLKSKAPIVQLATWNDWGEGTQIEPSHEFGYRDLETIQKLRVIGQDRAISTRRMHRDTVVPTVNLGGDRRATHSPADLRLPLQLLQQRRRAKEAGDSRTRRLDDIAELISSGDLSAARSQLDQR